MARLRLRVLITPLSAPVPAVLSASSIRPGPLLRSTYWGQHNTGHPLGAKDTRHGRRERGRGDISLLQAHTEKSPLHSQWKPTSHVHPQSPPPPWLTFHGSCFP